MKKLITRRIELKNIAIDIRSATYEQFLMVYYGKKLKFITFDELLKTGVDVDLLVFTGGADVDPKMYGEDRGRYTSINPERDKICEKTYKIYQHVPKLGICRGSQFLTVMAGGKLVQHVEKHTGTPHDCTVLIPKRELTFNITVTSTHHQMLFPYTLQSHQYVMLGWSTKHRSNVYLNGKNEQMELPTDFVEPEIVYYPSGKALAIQGHPEFPGATGKFKDTVYNLIDDFLLCQE